jgi:hypothetical protein
MSTQRPEQPIELQADAVVQLDGIERSDGVIRGMLERVLPSMFGTGYVLHLLGDGHRGTRSICSISSTSTQRAARYIVIVHSFPGVFLCFSAFYC